MTELYSHDDNYLLGLSYLEAFFAEDDERVRLIEETVPEDVLKKAFLLVNLVVLQYYSADRNVSVGRLIADLRDRFNANDK